MKDEKTRHVGYRLPEDLVKAIEAAAAAQGVTRTDIVCNWLLRVARAEGYTLP